MTDTLSTQVSVSSSSPTLLVSPIGHAQQVIIRNRDATISVFLGPSNVSATTGAELKAGETFSYGAFELPPETSIYAIAASGTPRVDVFQLVAD